MSQGLMSASEIGFPSPGVSAKAMPEPSITRAPAQSTLRINMFDLPFTVDTPAREAVVVLVRECQRALDRRLGFAAGGDEFGAQRLRVARLVPGAALQDDRLAVPLPGHAEAGEGLRMDGVLQRRLRPALPAVGGDQHLGDPAGAR